MLIKLCKSNTGNCPCLSCLKSTVSCDACLGMKRSGYAADTDMLCDIAKAYCEKVNGGNQTTCLFCEKWDWSEASATVDNNKYPHIHLALASTRFPVSKQFNFCPVCGRKNPYKEGDAE